MHHRKDASSKQRDIKHSSSYYIYKSHACVLAINNLECRQTRFQSSTASVPLSPLPSILNPLRHTLRPILKPVTPRTQCIPKRPSRTARRAVDSITDTASRSARHAAHSACDAAHSVSEGGCDPFGRACCALVGGAVADWHCAGFVYVWSGRTVKVGGICDLGSLCEIYSNNR